jgi:hypothetical protein
MTDHLLSWTAIGLALGWVIGLLGVLALTSGFDWFQWLITSMSVGLVAGIVAGLATLRARPTRYAEDDEFELWGETR